MTAPVSTSSAQARLTLQGAFERFAKIVTPDDAHTFNNSQLRDIRDEALQIERQLRARLNQRNMIRLEPFLRGIERYSRVMEVLCNGTPYLSWIWAPVMLVLSIAVDFHDASQKLIEAYGKIADLLPKLDRLSGTFSCDYNFQNVLALVYSDILDFHHYAYSFVRARSWKLLFGSMWARFETRFSAILRSLAYHSDLLDREAISINISEAVKYNQGQTQRWEQQEAEWHNLKIRDVLSWLRINESSPEQILKRHCRDSLPNSCDWFLQQNKIQLWQKDGAENALVWVTGKPGAGKSVLCSNVVQSVQANSLDVLYYFCSYLGDSSESCLRLLRSLACQVIQKRTDLAIYVYDTYFATHPKPDVEAMLGLLPKLLQELGSTRIIIDGLDEWNERDQRDLLRYLKQLISTDPKHYVCKILLSSRDTLEVSRNRAKQSKMIAFSHLSDTYESTAIKRSIYGFVDARLRHIPSHYDYIDPDGLIMARTKQKLLDKSGGMFLWVRLVLDSLDSIYSPEDLKSVVDDLPSDLDSLYARIFDQLCRVSGPQKYGGVPRIISWICYAQRPLHKHELLHAIATRFSDSCAHYQSIPAVQILDHCKPLIEIRQDDTVVLVHLSVKEFFLACKASHVTPFSMAQLDFSSVCVATLVNGLDLLNPMHGQTEILARIATGSHRLLAYAIEFWIEHCLLYANSKEVPTMQTLLLDRLSQMHDKHTFLLQALHHDTKHSIASVVPPGNIIDVRIETYADHPVKMVMRDVLYARQWVDQQCCRNGKYAEEFMEKHDPTLFSKLAINFEHATIQLLSHATMAGISTPSLQAFQRSYASTAFRCRFPNCLKTLAGFASEQLRMQHEMGHLRRVYCKVEYCHYSRIGFISKTALDNHTRNFHKEHSPLIVPPRIRRVAKARVFQLPARTKNQQDDPVLYPGSPQTPRLTSSDHHQEGTMTAQQQEPMDLAVSNTLADLVLDQLPAQYKDEGDDWHVVYNPRVRRVLTIKPIHDLSHESVVLCIKFSLDGRYVATGSNHFSQVFDVKHGNLVAHLQDNRFLNDGDLYIRSVCFSPNGQYLATGGEDKVIHVWDIASRQIKHLFTGHDYDVWSLDFASNGRIIASGSDDGSVRLWDLESNSQIAKFQTENAVPAVAISPDSMYVAAALTNNSVLVFDIQGSQLVNRIEGQEGHKDAVYGLSFTPSGNRLASCSFDKTIKMWELGMPTRFMPETASSGKCVRTFEGHKDYVISVAFTPHCDWLLSGSKDRHVQFWDPHTGVAHCMLKGHKNTVTSVASSPTGGVFATASADMRARIWMYDKYCEP